MEEEVRYEAGHFLNEKQKQLKQKIMEDCLDGLFVNLQENVEVFNDQSIIDLIFSILVMFNREVLTKLFITFQLSHKRKQVMRELFELIKAEVDKKVKTNMN